MKTETETGIFSSRTEWPEGLNPLAAALQKLKDGGHQVLDLTVSNPTQTGLGFPEEGLLQALQNKDNSKYDPEPRGLLPARNAVAAYYRRKGIEVNPADILITANTSEAYSFVFKLMIDPGESCLVPRPGYPILNDLATLNDTKTIHYELKPASAWSLPSLENQVQEKTRAVLTVHPNNPAGNYLKDADRKTLLGICTRHKLALISDEVFLDFHLDASFKPASFASEREILTFTLSGISKVLALPQMKISWIVVSGPDPLKKEALRRLEIIADNYLSASTPAQLALPKWFESEETVQNAIRERLRRNMEFLKVQSSAQNKISVLPVEGGWTVLLEFPDGKDDESWALEILEKQNVLVHPGYLYDFGGGSYLAASLLAEEHVFQEGMKKVLSSAG